MIHKKMENHQMKYHMLIILALLTRDVIFAYWPLLQFLLSPNAYLTDDVSKFVVSFALDPVLIVHLKLFDIAQRWAQKDEKHKEIAKIVIVYMLLRFLLIVDGGLWVNSIWNFNIEYWILLNS